ncbi:helix-turn-helix domain-containing protein [Ramlibacter sp. USB13]|uniref:Helix-turn-helix domain-containing protein n=1 Tax=Ramlibacter cellulosilyticus TaxID=2764187 RepID=A0A923MTY0_9BURK|nr:helix-turn-helix domain-containing protein [Ramlibacter cellulosilyticus]MBC5784698.1 helix-turn-helix domain-containing protein [Ramlibacter cellulosilyticus]
MNPASSQPVDKGLAASIASACQAWQSGDPCVPCALAAGADPSGLPQVASRRVKRRQPLYLEGDPFVSIYAVRTGTFKSAFCTLDAHEQVTGFQVAGEVLGLDGLGHGRHATSAIALEDSEVVALPYAVSAQGRPGELQRILPGLLGRELVRSQKLAVLLSAMGAEQRLASFLLNLSRRMETRGYSASQFNLRMTRSEIGSYLGLKVETVSRAFSAMQRRGMLEVSGRHVWLLDRPALLRLFDTAAARQRAALPGVRHG